MEDTDGKKIVQDKKVDSAKVEELMMAALRNLKQKKPFEKMNKMLGMTRLQYIENQSYERCYKTHKNAGMAYIGKR